MKAAGALLLAAVLAAPALTQDEQPGRLLALRFAPGETVRYRLQLTVETESKLTPLGTALTGEEPLRVAFDITWRVETVEVQADGAVRLRSVIEALEVESSAPGARREVADEFIGKPVAYRLRADGSVDELEAPEEWLENGEPPSWLRPWLEQASGSADDLPAHAVRPGETWSRTREFETPGLPRQRMTAESEYLGDELRGEAGCAAIMTRFEVFGEDSAEQELPGDKPSYVERRVEGSGSRLSCYDHGTGRLLDSTQSSQETIRLEMRAGKATDAAQQLLLESRTSTESHLSVVR